MSEYIIVKNSAGITISYGKNDGHYEPGLQPGQTLEIVSDEIAMPLIKELHDRLDAEAEAAKTAAQAKLSALGLTTDDLKALGL